MVKQTKWKSRAIQFFESHNRRVFSRKEIAEVLRERGTEIGTPRTMTVQRFIDALTESGHLRGVEIPSVANRNAADVASNRDGTLDKQVPKGPYKPFVRYVWDQATAFEVALSLRPESYLSHATAVFLHGLTTQIPHLIYANKEQSAKPDREAGLTQHGIDRAFAGRARTSNYVFAFDDTRMVLLSGKNTGNLEVTELSDPSGSPVSVTKLERTLIDITVRPMYAGGVYEVLEAFRGARERMSAATLVATLKRLSYAYPYHQAMGFYMKRAGYAEQQLQRLRAIPMEFDFYLANQIPEPEYDEEWRVYHPRGF